VTSALIGYTGFVGASLASAEHFDVIVNRANLESLRGANLQRLVCAGLPAAKWMVNQNPEADAENIDRLEATLRTVQARTVILISTIDVYPRTNGADETYDCSREPNHSYGRHRLRFEHFVREVFPHSSIVRLPALFGHGLKKNVLHDLLHDNRLERINPASRFQWYPLARLPRDLNTIETQGLPLVNLFTEPVETRSLLERLFPDKRVGGLPDPAADYDLRTRHGVLFGGDAHYVMTAAAVIGALGEFVRAELAQR
jgi:RmlD substrate binding domain